MKDKQPIKAESHARSLAKGFSFRIIATLDLVIISIIVTGSLTQALSIGFIEFFLKVITYYFHERLWQFYLKNKKQTKLISFTKAIVWRIFASSLTFLIALFIISDIENIEVGNQAFKIAGIEFFTKLVLYYFHERLWAKIPKGSFRKKIDILKKD